MASRYTRYMKAMKHDYGNPIKNYEFIMGDKFISEIISTSIFKRLRRINFLGAIDYTIVRHPNQSRYRYSRYQHSIGVAKLARFYSDTMEVDFKKRQLACIAALLHDLGHAPLSHSLEGVFEKYFDINHHKITNDLITGRLPQGKEIYEIIKWLGMDADQIVAVIEGKEDLFDGFFSGPINFDTIEGIMRSFTYAGNTTTSSLPENIVMSSSCRNLPNSQYHVDNFWQYKNLVYNNIINSYRGVLSDEICKFIMHEKIDIFSPSDYLMDEIELFKKLPQLKMILLSQNFEEVVWQVINKPISYKHRHFFIDNSVPFASKKDADRYRQGKLSAHISPPPEKEWKSRRHIGDLFK